MGARRQAAVPDIGADEERLARAGRRRRAGGVGKAAALGACRDRKRRKAEVEEGRKSIHTTHYGRPLRHGTRGDQPAAGPPTWKGDHRGGRPSQENPRGIGDSGLGGDPRGLGRNGRASFRPFGSDSSPASPGERKIGGRTRTGARFPAGAEEWPSSGGSVYSGKIPNKIKRLWHEDHPGRVESVDWQAPPLDDRLRASFGGRIPLSLQGARYRFKSEGAPVPNFPG